MKNLKMKVFKMSLGVIGLLTFSSAGWARTIQATGHGSAMGSCSYNDGYFCISNLKSSAERDGQWNAESNCRMQNGRPLGYSAYCSTNCFPNMIPPGQTALVSCNADCSLQCEVN
jgi:hypothetical protein